MGTTKPGAFSGIDIEDYHAGAGVSKSQLDHVARSPAHLQYARLHPRKDTSAFKIGRLTHLAVLEPELYMDAVAVSPEVDRRTKVGKATWASFCDDNEGREILTPTESAQIRGMQASVSQHPAANLLLSGDGPTRELSVYWEQFTTLSDDLEAPEDHPVLCRCRPDLLIPPGSVGPIKGGIIVDLKTTRDASFYKFRSSVRTFRYQVQAAWYLRGVNQGFANGEDMFQTFVFIAVEKDPPHGVAVYQLDQSQIAEGYELFRANLSTYARCTQSGLWPSYSPQIQTLSYD